MSPKHRNLPDRSFLYGRSYKAIRLVLEADVTYENVTLWNADSLIERGFDALFGQATVAFKEDNSNNVYTTHTRMISAIMFKDDIKVSPEHYYTFDRLTFLKGASYGPGLIVPHEYHGQYGIPILNPEGDDVQVAIISDGKLIVTTDYNISSIKNLNSTVALRKRCPKSARNDK